MWASGCTILLLSRMRLLQTALSVGENYQAAWELKHIVPGRGADSSAHGSLRLDPVAMRRRHGTRPQDITLFQHSSLGTFLHLLISSVWCGRGSCAERS